MNIIVKKTPTWRPLQPRLSHFNSLHKKDPSLTSAVLHPEKQFSKEELLRISNACRHTQMMHPNIAEQDSNPLDEDKLSPPAIPPNIKPILYKESK